MNIAPFVVAALVLIGWLWTLRAGAAIARYASEQSTKWKRTAVGNTIVSTIPLIVAVWLAWGR
jgi:hypothetical protein